MGGILSGLIGGMTKGLVGGYTAEGERRRKEEETGKSILSRMHMQALDDYENLSPEARNFHIQGLTKIYKMDPKIVESAMNIAHGIAGGANPQPTQAPAPPTPRTEPIGGAQRPVDVPLDLQDMTPAALPKPAVVPNAPFAPPSTFNSLAQQAGISTNPNQQTPRERKLLQAEMFKENQAERQRQEADYYKQQEYQQIRQAGKDLGLPPDKVAAAEFKKRTGYDIEGVKGTFANEGFFTDKDNVTHKLSRNTKNPSLLHDDSTGQDFSSIPEGWTPAAPPRNWAPAVVTSPGGATQLVEKGGPNKGKVTMTEAKGRIQYPPTKTVNDLDAEGNPVQRVLTTPEAVRESKATGGFSHPPVVDIGLSNHAKRMLAVSNNLKRQITELQSIIGPFAGRLTEAEIKAGRIPGVDEATGKAIAAKARELDAGIKSFAALNPKLHGFRSVKSFDEFMAAGPRWHEDPEMALGALKGLDDTIGTFVLKGKGKTISAPPEAGAAAPTAGKKKFKYNMQTGQLE